MAEGIVNISDGESFSWFAGGKTEMSVKNNLEVIYGTSTSVAIGLKNEFWLGHTSEISIGSKIDVSVGPSFTLSEATELDSKEHDDAHYMTSWTSTIGASPTQILAMKKLRYAAFVLVGLQTALMMAAAITATVRMKEDPEAEELVSPGVGVTLTVLPQLAAIGAGITAAVLACMKKWGSLKDMGDPAAALTMDADGGIFLGTRKASVPNTYTAGVLINETGVQINAAQNDLGYDQPAESDSIIGFTQDADSQNGTRVEFANDGGTRIYGKSMRVALKASAGKALNVALAEEHHLKVTGSNSLTPTDAGVSVSSDGVLLKRDATTAISAQNGSVNAIVGGANGSAMRLTPTGASLSSGMNFMSVDNSGVYLRFGSNTFQISQLAITLCSNLTVLGGGAAGPFTGLADAIRDITTLSTALTATYTAEQVNQTAFDTARNITDIGNRTAITVRDTPTTLLEKLKWPS